MACSEIPKNCDMFVLDALNRRKTKYHQDGLVKYAFTPVNNQGLLHKGT